MACVIVCASLWLALVASQGNVGLVVLPGTIAPPNVFPSKIVNNSTGANSPESFATLTPSVTATPPDAGGQSTGASMPPTPGNTPVPVVPTPPFPMPLPVSSPVPTAILVSSLTPWAGHELVRPSAIRPTPSQPPPTEIPPREPAETPPRPPPAHTPAELPPPSQPRIPLTASARLSHGSLNRPSGTADEITASPKAPIPSPPLSSSTSAPPASLERPSPSPHATPSSQTFDPAPNPTTMPTPSADQETDPLIRDDPERNASQQRANAASGNASVGSILSSLGIIFGAAVVLVVALCVVHTRRVHRDAQPRTPLA